MKQFLIALFSLVCLSSTQAQYSDNYFDVGAMVGMSSYTGDLAPSPFQIKHLHIAAGAFGRYNFGQWVSARLGVNYGRISGDDADSRRADRRNRNLMFRSTIWEVGLTGEWNMLGYHPRALERKFSPYLFLGVAWFHHNPQARGAYTESWVDLRSLGTEGQNLGYDGRTPYKKWGISVPMGVGVKVAINSRWGIGAELGFRKTFTDYLDDVSLSYVPEALWETTRVNGVPSFSELMSDRSAEVYAPAEYYANRGSARGDERDFDWYIFAGLTVSYHFLDEGLVGSSKRGRRKAGCKGARF